MTIAIAAPLPLRPRLARNLRVATLLALVLFLNAADLACSLFAHRIGELEENNPLADAFLRLGLVNSLISYKVLLVCSGCFMLWRLRRSPWSVPACWILVTAYAALAVAWCVWMRDVNFTLEVQLSMGYHPGP
jgi:hypothetical protein